MSEYDEFKKIEAEVGALGKADPYAKFKLRPLLDDDPFDDKLFVNYNEEKLQLFRHVARHINSGPELKVPNKVIAIVGKSGSGKTSLVNQLFEKLEMYSGLSTARNLKFAIKFGAKYGDAKYLEDRLPIKGLTRGIIFLDDAHFGYYPENDGSRKDPLKTLSSKVSESVIITTWDIFGWSYVMSVVPDFIKYFDEVIYLDGLNYGHMIELVKKRTERYSFAEEPFDYYNTFNEAGVTHAFDTSQRNPRLFLIIVDGSLTFAFKEGKDKVDDVSFENAVSALGYEGEVEDLLHDNVVYYMLSAPSNTIKDLLKFIKVDRSTLQKRLQELVKRKIVFVHEHGEGESIPKGKYYQMNPLAAVRMEDKMCEEVKKSIHRFLITKVGGENMGKN
ncbi:hypothetical protein HYU11_03025 [Candidatus Woesearchaeota archaeon]|nr:hypothetical protein [Candidatus Woesearchaeota archaeon]